MDPKAKITISQEEFRSMQEKLLLPVGAPVDEAIRKKVESWYQEMLPFVKRMSEHRFDCVAPAIVITVR